MPFASRWRKWDGSEHWRYDGLLLGEDAWGTWYGHKPGTRYVRPGRDFLGDTANVSLVPRTGQWAAAFYPEEHPDDIRVYIDLAWDVSVSQTGLEAIDMDLDVVRLTDGTTWIDDEDEFEQHSAEFGYPQEVIDAVAASASRLETVVRDRVAPFDELTPAPWFIRLEALDPDLEPRPEA